MYLKIFMVLLFVACISIPAFAQDSTATNSIEKIPDKVFQSVDKKASVLEAKLDRQTDKYLSKMERQENKLRRKLWKKDSTQAKELFDKTAEKYNSLRNISGKLDKYQALYSGHLDSLSTAMKFLQNENIEKISSNPYLQKSLGAYKQLQEKFNQTNQIKNYLAQRKMILKQAFQRLGMVKEYKKFEKEAYYYRAQVDEYKRMFEDPSKLEARLLNLVLKIPRFKNFFATNSVLGSLFPNMGPVNSNGTVAAFGLQTRASLNQYLNTRFSGAVNYNQAFQQNIGAAQGQIDELRSKLMSITGGSVGSSSEFDIPDFKPNEEHTKSFLKRLEYGTNFQTAHGTSWFPVTTDLGLSMGYKLNQKNVIGLGASYKIGLGKDIRHIDVSSQGAGFRSFADINIKKSFFLSGGFEYNYQQSFSSIREIYSLDAWQQSGLVGVSKIVALQTKFFKKTKIQLLWDFLSYRQRPQTQAFKFRIGYNF